MKQAFNKLLVVVMIFGVAATVGCSKSSKSTKLATWLGGEDPQIFSNRHQTQTNFLALLKLKSSPLLITAVKKNGHTEVDSELAKNIDVEQEQLIQDLKKLSSDIHVLYRYRMVLNAVAVIAPISLLEQIKGLANVAYAERAGNFARPVLAEAQKNKLFNTLGERNSVKFIGADKVHDLKVKLADGTEVPVQGHGIKVGIIDTGIDYTHSMLGGAGTAEAYKAIDPSKESASFPNAKVVGGIDLVGTTYDSASGDLSRRFPTPDLNPLDEAGHGTHVAGTIAGVGDGVETYSGVAPDAELYAIKVFGADGSTGDAVVIAGLEYAADPNKDGNLNDQLDVVNLSLGSSYGIPHVLYDEAMGNLAKGGTFVVVSAGNSGANDYIVGGPSTVDEALSVAASIDNADHNWQFGAVKFNTSAGVKIVEAIEGSITKPIQEAGSVSGKLVYIGVADKELSPEVKDSLKGQVALIDRGIVPFADKIKKAADAGAIGVVVANNIAGKPLVMGGEGKFDIPSIMVTQDVGVFLKEQMKLADVTIDFLTAEKFEKPELIDTLTDFSSKGPRSLDGFFKPEISAPGDNVVSASMGEGNLGVKMSGTSMAAPHMTGVMALMKQLHPDLSSAELKSLVMGTSVTIHDEDKKVYPLTRQGAGRVDAFKASQGTLVSVPAAVSLGEINIEKQAVYSYDLTLKNISAAKIEGNLALSANPDLKLLNPQAVSLEAGESKLVTLKISVGDSGEEPVKELDGYVQVLQGGTELIHIPILAVTNKISQIKATELKVQATSEASAAHAVTTLTLTNKGVHDGLALPFNLLGVDQRKSDPSHDNFKSKACDLESVGYRVIDKQVDGKALRVLQVAAKLYEPMTTWNPCQFSVLIDANNDEVADQELAGILRGDLEGISDATNETSFVSVLLDAEKTRQIRKAFEIASLNPKSELKEDYTDAVTDILPMKPFNHSSVMVIEADVTQLMTRASGELAVKIASLLQDPSSAESDDFLGNEKSGWRKLALSAENQAFYNLPEQVSLKAGAQTTVEFKKGTDAGRLLMLYPNNSSAGSVVQKNSQSEIVKAIFSF